jgi:hypothetical protein
VAIQEVTGDKRSSQLAHNNIFFRSYGNANHHLGTGSFSAHKRIRSVVKSVELVSDRKSCIILRNYWCNIIVLNAHAPNKRRGISRLAEPLVSSQERLCSMEIVMASCTRYHAARVWSYMFTVAQQKGIQCTTHAH